jgi:hypothetical protein
VPQIFGNSLHPFVQQLFVKGTPIMLCGSQRQATAARLAVLSNSDNNQVERYCVNLYVPSEHRVYRRELRVIEIMCITPVQMTVCIYRHSVVSVVFPCKVRLFEYRMKRNFASVDVL